MSGPVDILRRKIFARKSEYVEIDGCLDGLGLLDIFASRLHPKVVLMESSCLRMQLAGKNLVDFDRLSKNKGKTCYPPSWRTALFECCFH